MFADYMSRTIAAQLIRTYSKARLKGGGRMSIYPSLSPTMSEAVDYMTANIDTAINLSDIAQAINRSPSHIARMFRTELGMPPHRYLINLRVEKALQRGLEGGLRLEAPQPPGSLELLARGGDRIRGGALRGTAASRRQRQRRTKNRGERCSKHGR